MLSTQCSLEIVENIRSLDYRFRQRFVFRACCLAPGCFVIKIGNVFRGVFGVKRLVQRTSLCLEHNVVLFSTFASIFGALWRAK